MMYVKLTGESKKPFHYFYPIPDSKSLTNKHKHPTYDHKAEVLLGKSKENLSKVQTITTSTNITTIHHLQAYHTNMCAIIKAQFT